MPVPKQPDLPGPPKATSPAHPAAAPDGAARKPWKKRGPAELLTDETAKLHREIAQDEKDLAEKRKQLTKLEEALKVFQSA